MKVFMTGANGFVGLNVVRALVEHGHDVTTYVRPTSNVKFLEPLGVTIYRGELGDKSNLAKAMKGAERVICTAGNTSCYMRDLPILEEVNVRGTQCVLDCAIENEVPRIVYTSTTSTVGANNNKTKVYGEATPLSGFRSKSPYAITKLKAENILKNAQEKGIECIILNLAEVIGPYDYNMQWGRLVLAVHYDQVPFIPPGGATFCNATNVGKAHVNALTMGRSGEKYILGGEHHDIAHLLSVISKLNGNSFKVPRTSYKWLYFKSLLQEKIPVLVPGKPMVEPYRMRVFGGHYYFDSSKAINELSYEQSALEEMLGESMEWYKQNGYFQ